MEVNYTKVLAQKILLTFLFFTVVFSMAALFLYDTITGKLADISDMASNIEQKQEKPEHILLLLQQAEDDFQQSLLDTNSKKNNDYKIKLSEAFHEVDTLLNHYTNPAYLTTAQSNKIKQWGQKRTKLSKEFFLLKHEFDSLLSVYANFNTIAKVDVTSNQLIVPIAKLPKTDTIQKTIPAKKRGFFKRLREAILNENSSAAIKVIEIRPRALNTKAPAIHNTAAVYKEAYTRRLQQLQEQNAKVLNLQGKLISLNTHISSELKRINNSVREINSNMAEELKATAFKSYRETTELLNKVHLVALLFVFLFAALLIIFITQLNRSEKNLRRENERSVTIAQQKMDLLYQMSHEIRNPLNAIKGFLYVFGKTGLTKQQSDMLGSIKLSSDMLLQTLDDTLDAAKMENSEFRINEEPFSPDETLRKVIESMEYSAAKKKLSIDYFYTGDVEAIVEGDGFRLRQILGNLLSNAIKYTDEGGIVITATMESEEHKLHVVVKDTGAGISSDQQTNLFSKYYQTNSSKGKTGTGLGLFICKQLVELQEGKISVKSVSGEGSAFSFYIPYRKTERKPVNKQDQEKAFQLPDGLKILAADDSELNLGFLKMMTKKWKVKFHAAANGKQALEILAKHDIDVVLTDLQMPVMNGYELLLAIKALGKPFDELPVIVISGEAGPESNEKMLSKGFSGLVSKPLNEALLKMELLKALKTINHQNTTA